MPRLCTAHIVQDPVQRNSRGRLFQMIGIKGSVPHWVRSLRRARNPCWSAQLAAILVILFECASMVIDPMVFDAEPLRVPRTLHVLCALCVLGVLRWRRRELSSSLGMILFIVVMLPVFPIVWYSQTVRTAANLDWSLFIGHKLAALIFAALTPGAMALGLLFIGLLAVEATVQSFKVGLSAVPGEPWATLVVMVGALFILINRTRTSALERQFQRTRLATESAAEFASVALAIGDLTNTPLQVLTLEVEILRQSFLATKKQFFE